MRFMPGHAVSLDDVAMANFPSSGSAVYGVEGNNHDGTTTHPGQR
jgi:hypothetical protein